MSQREPDLLLEGLAPEQPGCHGHGRSGTGSASALEAWIDDLRRAEKRQLQAQRRDLDVPYASRPAADT